MNFTIQKGQTEFFARFVLFLIYFIRYKIKIIRGDYAEADAFMFDYIGDVVLTVDMTVVAVGHVILMEYIDQRLADILREHGREMEERRQRKRFRECGI